LVAATGALCLLTLGGFLARWTQPFELISHFRLHYAAALLGVGLLSASFRAWRASTLAACCLCVNLAAIVMSVLPAAPAAQSGGSQVRVVWANLERHELSLSLLAELARAQKADIVAITELPEGGADIVRNTFQDFACFTSPTDPPTPFTTMIVSREPCSRKGQASNLSRPSDAAYLDVEELRTVAIHPRPPGGKERTAERDGVIEAGVHLALGTPQAVLIGDFNATPWSPVLIDVRRRGFRRALCGAPLAPTWRSANPLFGLTIDHAYVYGDAAIADCRVGPDIGSDHRPLIVDVSVGGTDPRPSRLQH
jgi:endonuclease/exonuclease/phosphatase (EEP) superfamily protein YafD